MTVEYNPEFNTTYIIHMQCNVTNPHLCMSSEATTPNAVIVNDTANLDLILTVSDFIERV
jgi:hypothetical protein